MTKPKPPDGDDLADLSHVLPPAPSNPAPRRLVATESGIGVLQSGGTLEEALAADDAQDRRWQERLDAEAQERRDAAERRRLDLDARRARAAAEAAEREDRAAKLKLDVAERRLRVNDRLRRLRARETRSDGRGSS